LKKWVLEYVHLKKIFIAKYNQFDLRNASERASSMAQAMLRENGPEKISNLILSLCKKTS